DPAPAHQDPGFPQAEPETPREAGPRSQGSAGSRVKAGVANSAQVSQVPLGDGINNEDLAESVAAGMELMSVEDDKKKWNDGFVSAEPDAPAAAAPIAAETSVPDNDNGEENDDATRLRSRKTSSTRPASPAASSSAPARTTTTRPVAEPVVAAVALSSTPPTSTTRRCSTRMREVTPVST
ncbi:unnamed protein product, partial [Ectocarpus sp. 6 AP-2014]